MAVTPKKLYGGTLSTTTSTVLYTVPSATTCVVTSITVCNKTSSVATVTVAVDGTSLFSGASVPANTTWTLGPEDVRLVMTAATTITGGAGTSSAIDLRISGTEIS